MVTVSCIKGDIGGWVGHYPAHPETAEQKTTPLEYGQAFAAAVGTGGFVYLGFASGGEPAALAATAAVGLACAPTTGGLVRRQIRRLFNKHEMLAGAQALRDLGCERLYPNRKGAMADIIEAALAQGRRKVGTILAAGVSLRDFLHHRFELDDGSFFIDKWAELLNEGDSEVYCDLVILYHGCREAQRRAAYERGVETIRELVSSKESYRFFFEGNPRVRCGLSRLRPSIFAFVTDDAAFVQRYLSAPPPEWRAGCYGGLLPVEWYPGGTPGYDFVKGELLGLKSDEAVRWI